MCLQYHLYNPTNLANNMPNLYIQKHKQLRAFDHSPNSLLIASISLINGSYEVKKPTMSTTPHYVLRGSSGH